jgi:hypothetical protein
MNVGRTVLSRLLEHLQIYEFRRCATRHGGNELSLFGSQAGSSSVNEPNSLSLVAG